jgi:hypothetical protein
VCAHFPSAITTIIDQKLHVKTVELTRVVYHVAEQYNMHHAINDVDLFHLIPKPWILKIGLKHNN